MSVFESGLDFVLKSLKVVEVGRELLGERVQPRPISMVYGGLCPFHNEKTPSFFLKPKKNFYVCYGCHSVGSALELPFDVLGAENGLAYYESRFGMKRDNSDHMVVLKWNLEFAAKSMDHLTLGRGGGCFEFLDSFDPIFGSYELQEKYSMIINP